MSFYLGEDNLTWSKLVDLSKAANPEVFVSDKAWKQIDNFRDVVDQALVKDQTIYGINTGFGFLSDVRIESKNLELLQLNLIRSHACGVGEVAQDSFVRALLILRAHTFLLGHSAVTRSTINQILNFLKFDILPIVPMQGSVGASGDLAPLSHLALGLIGEGSVVYEGKKISAKIALEKCKLKPLSPKAKEGLSLINGTQFMAVLGAFALASAHKCLKSADVAVSLSLDAIRGTVRAFDSKIQSVRKQPGQAIVAENVRSFFTEDDQILNSHENCGKVQDPYSFRCVPQVHGASLDVFNFVEERINGDLNSITDNPLVFLDGEVVSGGNFHGQPLAMALDFLAIAVAEIGSISERRIEKLTNPAMSGLPAFVISDGGLNSGFMIPHVVAAALVSENKILCHPASVDSIPTSADKEDHVSMGPIAGRKALKVCEHVAAILAIELLTACQGLDLLRPLVPGPRIQKIYDGVRLISDKLVVDRSLHEDIENVSQWLKSEKFLELVHAANPDFKI